MKAEFIGNVGLVKTVSISQVKPVIFEQLKRLFDNLAAVRSAVSEGTMQRLEIPLARLDPLSWLRQQSHTAKVYWADRNNRFEAAGVGIADLVCGPVAGDFAALFVRLNQHLSTHTDSLRYYGGLRFSMPAEQDQGWRPFGGYRFVVPRFEVYRQNSIPRFVCNFIIDPDRPLARQLDALGQELEQINFALEPPSGIYPALVSRQDIPDQADWHRNIKATLEAFWQLGRNFEKVVLARKSTFAFAQPLDLFGVLKDLKQTNPESFYFGFQVGPGLAFIGASPERLYRRFKQQIQSEAVAGTCPRGETPEEDRELAMTLLHSEKDRREHRYVVDSIKTILEEQCTQVEMEHQVSILKLARVQHLCTRFQGILAVDHGDAEIIAALHPTPAVGGYPKEKAMEVIETLESFDRGWYAGPVGWVGAEAAEFVVAIRSGLIENNHLSLFSGAGIVQGSTPEAEWSEIENKISNFMKIFSR